MAFPVFVRGLLWKYFILLIIESFHALPQHARTVAVRSGKWMWTMCQQLGIARCRVH
jgi:hypothetical protein